MLVHALTLISVVGFALLIGWRRGGSAAGLYLCATAGFVLAVIGIANVQSLVQFVLGLFGIPFEGTTYEPVLLIAMAMGMLIGWQFFIVIAWISLRLTLIAEAEDDESTTAVQPR